MGPDARLYVVVHSIRLFVNRSTRTRDAVQLKHCAMKKLKIEEVKLPLDVRDNGDTKSFTAVEMTRSNEKGMYAILTDLTQDEQ